MVKQLVFIVLLAAASSEAARGQTLAKEAVNNFALYSKTRDFSLLEKAKKAIDGTIKSHKDSLSYRNNLLKGMIYSTLCNADNSRKLSYVKDPAEEALFALRMLEGLRSKGDHEAELDFCRKQLAVYFSKKAGNDLSSLNMSAAIRSYLLVDSLNGRERDNNVRHNLAVLNQRTGNLPLAERYYLELTGPEADRPIPAYFLELSTVYEQRGDEKSSLAILQKGREKFPKNRDIVFKIINKYADQGQYEAITPLIDDAVNMDPENRNLIYLAAFSYDITGNRSLAEQYYRKSIEMEPNNFDANYSLGLLYLNLFVKNNKDDSLGGARRYLQNAAEINPNGINVLKSLAILYKQTGETVQLERVNHKLNQIIFN